MISLKPELSILIVTKDRPSLLAECLMSIKQQTFLPSEIIVVDNGQDDSAKKIITNFTRDLKIKYCREKKQGEAFARNRALKLAKGEILAFIDDDCAADKTWLENILLSFENHPQIDGVLGKPENLLKDNIYAIVYQCYYCRWLMENFKNITQPQILSEKNNFFDTKNVSLKRKSVRNFSFDQDLPNILHCSLDIDLIAGNTLMKRGNFFYSPRVVVYHQNPSSFKELMTKNFICGVANRLILERKKINIRKKPFKYSYIDWLRLCYREAKGLNFFPRIIFWVVLFIYPVPYKLGRLAFRLGFFQ